MLYQNVLTFILKQIVGLLYTKKAKFTNIWGSTFIDKNVELLVSQG